mmetsp:Transcript_8616/g.27461  ORF Transcript_8616/g.27461 Transcript_8616/m.27461 type:complete len:392 (-) Transcript_8616:703-1878(-)
MRQPFAAWSNSRRPWPTVWSGFLKVSARQLGCDDGRTTNVPGGRSASSSSAPFRVTSPNHHGSLSRSAGPRNDTRDIRLDWRDALDTKAGLAASSSSTAAIRSSGFTCSSVLVRGMSCTFLVDATFASRLLSRTFLLASSGDEGAASAGFAATRTRTDLRLVMRASATGASHFSSDCATSAALPASSRSAGAPPSTASAHRLHSQRPQVRADSGGSDSHRTQVAGCLSAAAAAASAARRSAAYSASSASRAALAASSASVAAAAFAASSARRAASASAAARAASAAAVSWARSRSSSSCSALRRASTAAASRSRIAASDSSAFFRRRSVPSSSDLLAVSAAAAIVVSLSSSRRIWARGAARRGPAATAASRSSISSAVILGRSHLMRKKDT